MTDGGNEAEWIENSKKMPAGLSEVESMFLSIKDLEAEIERLRSAKRELDVLTTIIERLPQGTWEVWNSNSFRRITARINGRNGVDGGVLSGTIQRSDNHPDLSMSEEQLQALCDLRNTVARLCGVDQ